MKRHDVGWLFYAAAIMVLRNKVPYGCGAVHLASGFSTDAKRSAIRIIRKQLDRHDFIVLSPHFLGYRQEGKMNGTEEDTSAIRRFARAQWLFNLSAQHGGPGSKGIAE